MGLLAKVQRAVRHVGKKDRHSREAEEGKTKATSDKATSKKKTSPREKPTETENDSLMSVVNDEKPPVKSSTQVVAGGKLISGKASVTPGTVDAFFDRYRNTGEDAILAEGMERLCTDMAVDPTDVRMLALAWKFGAVTMCRFSREQFVSGCLRLVVDNASALRDVLPSLVDEGQRSFRDFYKFTFDFGLDSGERCLTREMAVALWRLVLPVCSGEMCKFTNRWCDFLEKTRVRGVTRDCWMVFLEFCQVVDEDFSNYSDEDAWPSLLDEFVEDQLRRRSLAQGSDRTQRLEEESYE